MPTRRAFLAGSLAVAAAPLLLADPAKDETQPIPVGDATVPQCAEPIPGYDQVGCIYTPFWETPVLIQPSGVGGTS